MYTYILLRSGLDVDEVILDEKKAKMMHITAIMMSQAAYHGYQPAPTGRAPKIIATAPIMMLYNWKATKFDHNKSSEGSSNLLFQF